MVRFPDGKLMNYDLESTPNLSSFIADAGVALPWPTPSGFLPPTMSYVTYDVVRHARTTSYV